MGSTFTLKLPMKKTLGTPDSSSAAIPRIENLTNSPLRGLSWNLAYEPSAQLVEYKVSDTQHIHCSFDTSETSLPQVHCEEDCNEEITTATTALLRNYYGGSTSRSTSQKSLINGNSRQLRVNSGDSGRTDGPTGSSAKSLYSMPGGTDSSKSFKSPKEETNDGRRFLHVLIVDDSKMNRKMLAKSIAQICSFEEAEDGQIAVEKVLKSMGVSGDQGDIVKDGNQTYDAILMDFMMPRMDGPTATREIIRAGYTGLVIGVTGNAMQADIDYFLASGAVSVLVKPLDLNKLVRVLGNLLEPRRL